MGSHTYLSASLLFPGDGPPRRDGWVCIEDGLITATGSPADLPRDVAAGALRHHEGCALLPGLVNLHCHLELTTLHDRLTPGQPFPHWVEQLRGYTAGLDAADYHHAARVGVERLVAGGCTTVLDVGNTGEALGVLRDPRLSPLRAFACVETLGLDPAYAAPRYEAAAQRALGFERQPHEDETSTSMRFHAGVAPHAAYSMSADLLRRVIESQRTRGLPVTIHAAESREEAELFATGTGPLADYCRRIYSEAPHHRNTTPVRWLESEGLLPDGVILVHGNTLEAADMDILARRGATVVHCPSSHKFFGHPRFPYEELRARGINVGLGTDSLASGDSLSMTEQMRLFAESYPAVSTEEIVRLATINGARALGLKDVGLLKPGWRADIAVASLTNLAVAKYPA